MDHKESVLSAFVPVCGLCSSWPFKSLNLGSDRCLGLQWLFLPYLPQLLPSLLLVRIPVLAPESLAGSHALCEPLRDES